MPSGMSILCVSLCMTLPSTFAVEGYTMIPRWGHSSTVVSSPPTLIIQGGKTDPSSSYTYSSAPNTADTIILPLSSGFTTSSPPFSLLNATTAPISAWHTLTPLSDVNQDYSMLSFGGDGGTIEAVQTQNDSTWLLSVNFASQSIDFTQEPTGWGNQPMRRIHHSSASLSMGGDVYITGGLKDDGSGVTFADVYQFNSTNSAFSTLPSLPQGLYHHSSILLPNGTLIVLGGVYASPTTGSGVLLPFSTLYVFDTTSTTASWVSLSIGGTVPFGRRGATVALNNNGTTAFIFGGADAELATVYGDGWELDVASCAWQQVVSSGQGAGERYDHTAVTVGGDQIIIFGGYAASGPASAALSIYDMSSNSWLDSFTPVSIPSSSVSSSGSDGIASGSGGIGSGTVATETLDTVGTGTASGRTTSAATGKSGSGSGTIRGSSEVSGSATQRAHSSSASTRKGDASSPLSSTAVRVGLIFGILTVACLVVAGLIYRYQRRRRRLASLKPGAGTGVKSCRGPSRPYGSREKGGEGLIEDSLADEPNPVWNGREKPVNAGLGMGAIGANLANFRTKFVGRPSPNEQYIALGNETKGGVPERKSTRRIGTGIRLVGPRSQPSEDKYAAIRLGTTIRPLSTARDLRRDMLRDEDSRNFAKSRDEDWVPPNDESNGPWKPAHSLLGAEREENEDEEEPFGDDDESSRPPMRGGPVPTPPASRSDFYSFEDSSSRRDSYAQGSRPRSERWELPPFSTLDDSDLSADLEPPPLVMQDSENSLPRSQRSGQSSLTSDAEDAVVRHAQIGSHQTASLISPVESAYVPISRSESFFRRMTTGGIASLLTRQPTRHELDVRDPAPLPTLWRIDPATPVRSYTHSSWDVEALRPPQLSHLMGPSLLSLQSAHSMRDMVIMQRQTTNSSIGTEAVIEVASPVVSEPDRPEGAGHHRHGLTIGSETPGSIVFDCADLASPIAPSDKDFKPSLPSHQMPTTAGMSVSSLTIVPHQPPPFPNRLSPTVSVDSPVPSPLLSHRRAVRDVVNSINKRAGATPPSILSPVSQYSPAPVSPQRSGVLGRPPTMYEAVRRSPLTITNPDGRREWSSGG